jgi:hypothetical protein
MDTVNAKRARAGLLPRKAPPVDTRVPPVDGAVGPLPGAPAAPALSQADRAASPPADRGVPAAAPEPATFIEKPAGGRVALVDVVVAAIRSRSPARGAEGQAERATADTSLETLGVRVRDAVIESLIVGRAGELTVSVQTGSGERLQETAARGPGVAAAGAVAADVGPAPGPASGDEEDPDLVSRRRTAAGEVVERRLDPSGTIVERQVDPPDGWQRVIDVSKLTLVSQRRVDDGAIVQVVEDVSGAHIEVTRDPIGRFAHARVLRR